MQGFNTGLQVYD